MELAVDLEVSSGRALFDIPEDVVYMNASTIGPRLKSVAAAGHGAVDRFSNPWTITPPDWYKDPERQRLLAAKLMNADADGIALIPAVSYGMATAAKNLPVSSGQSIAVLDEEFPSNYYAWKRVADDTGAELRVVKRSPDGCWCDGVLAAIDSTTAVVSVPACHWTDGSLTGLEDIARRVRSRGAALVIDASQSLGVMPLDVQALDADFVISVGYKWLLGPYSVSYMYVAPRWRNGRPLEEGWVGRADSEDQSRLVDYRGEYRDGARRFDSGEQQNFVLLPMAVAGLEQMTAWRHELISKRLRDVTDRIALEAEKQGIEITPAALRAPHILGLHVGGDRARSISNSLRQQGIYVSPRGSSIRISPHMHITDSDVDRFAEALRRAL